MGARGGDRERLRPLIRLLLTTAMRRLMSVELRPENGQAVMPHRHRLLMMLDEFPSLGRLQIVQDALPTCAGYGIKAFLAAQNRAQLFGVYGPDQSITADCHVRIIHAPDEPETAEWLSTLAGSAPIVIEDGLKRGTRYGAMRNVSPHYHEVGRPLLTPDEIMTLRKPLRDPEGWFIDPGDLMVLIAGERPIQGAPILYYLDRVFRGRAMVPPPPVSGAISRTAPASRESE